MNLGRRATGRVAILSGIALFIAACVGYFAYSLAVGQGEPMAVALNVPSPLVVVAAGQAPAIEACVTPRAMGEKTRVQFDRQDVVATPVPWSAAVPPTCAGTALGVSPHALTPGVHRLTYSALYSNRYERRIGVSVAVGPFDDREQWMPCAARIWIGQDFLDAGGASTDDLAHTIEAMLRQRRFTEPCLTGKVVESQVRISWIRSGLAMSAMMRLDTGDVIKMKAELALSSRDGRLHIHVPASSLDAGIVGPSIFCERTTYARRNPFLAVLFAADVATEINLQAHKKVREGAAEMIAKKLLGPVRALLEAPRPLQLVDSPEAQLDVRYGDLEIAPEHGAMLCIDLRATTTAHAERNVPGPMHTPATPPPPLPERSQALRIDLSLQALNAALDAGWRVGLLDRLLAGASTVWTELFTTLTVRPTAMRFELPPVILPGATGPEITLGDLRVTLEDRVQPDRLPRIADLWARVALSARFVLATKSVELAATLQDFGLSCQLGRAGQHHLYPCFSDAVQMLQAKLLKKSIAADAVGVFMVPVEKWLPGEADEKAAFSLELKEAELRPMAGGGWYQLLADVGVRNAARH